MADSVTVEILGLQELGVRMRALAAAMNNKISGRATGAGAQVIKREIKANAPIAKEAYKDEQGRLVQPGNIGKNVIIKKLSKNQTQLTSEHIVTIRHKGAGVIGSPYRTAIFNEFGTVKMSPNSFFRRSFDAKKFSAADAIVEQLRIAIEKAEI